MRARAWAHRMQALFHYSSFLSNFTIRTHVPCVPTPLLQIKHVLYFLPKRHFMASHQLSHPCSDPLVFVLCLHLGMIWWVKKKQMSYDMVAFIHPWRIAYKKQRLHCIKKKTETTTYTRSSQSIVYYDLKKHF